MDDMIDYLGYEMCHDKWSFFVNSLVQFSKSEDIEIRTASVFGLGKLTEKTPQQVYPNFYETIFQAT